MGQHSTVGYLAKLLACLSLCAPVHAAGMQAPAVTPLASQALSLNDEAIRADVAAVMRRERIPGAQVVAVTREGTIWRGVFGLADVEGKRAMTFDTPIQIGSVTKVFTATLIADLVAQQRLNWNDTLGKIFPGVAMRPEVARISLAELASHTSGLPKDPPNRVDVEGVWRPYTRSELYAALNEPALKFADQEWNYSNFGFAILGHVAEKVSGEPYETILRRRLLNPLGMDATSVQLSPSRRTMLAVHYWPEDNPLRPRPAWVFGEIAGFGGITSTADNLARFLRFHINPRAHSQVLEPAAIIGMRSPRVLFPDWQVAFGRPWAERRERDGTLVIEHAGEVDGHSAIMMFSPAQGVGVVVAANLGQSGAQDIATAVFQRILTAARALSQPRDRAMNFYHTGQWADAEAAFEKLTTAAADDGDAWFRLGRARFELADWSGSKVALERALALPKPSRNTFYYLAIIHANAGTNDRAIELLDDGLKAGLEPEDLSGPQFRSLASDPRFQRLQSGENRRQAAR